MQRCLGRLFVYSLVAVSTLTSAAQAAKESAGSREASVIGHRVHGFILNDSDGKRHALDEYSKYRLVVLTFLGVECPLVKLLRSDWSNFPTNTNRAAYCLSASIRIARTPSQNWPYTRDFTISGSGTQGYGKSTSRPTGC